MRVRVVSARYTIRKMGKGTNWRDQSREIAKETQIKREREWSHTNAHGSTF